ncbi:MAG: bifunctional metallophosphatase/5'-nucleotidase [Chloroflexi bacterium]|nr:bifunctional metallophosphatase/5'-nucleotidase [Chloroflexota bacterium]MCL5076147.1 bifunctional metallophosphatase/5'-nucleotidase [Chloroflexota bacterium]
MVTKGGLARRATAIRQERAQGGNVLLLDAGNTLLGQPIANRTQGRVIVAAMNLLKYDAMTLGDQDFQLGPEVVQARAKEAAFPFLSANVVKTGTNELVAQPYKIMRIGGRKVAIIGLTDLTRPSPTAPEARGVSSLDILAMAKEYVAEVKRETNIIILLSHLGPELDKKIAKEVPGITVIVGSAMLGLPQPPAKVEGAETLLVQDGRFGEQLSVLHLHIDGAGKVTNYEGKMLTLTAEAFPDDPEMVKLLEPYRKE